MYASGTLKSKRSTTLAFLQGGHLDEAAYDMGDFANKGDTLAKLDVRALQADFDRAQAGMEKAERDFQRAKELSKNEAIPYETLQNAETGLKSAEAILSAAKFALDHGYIIAPFSGKITGRYLEPGVIAPPGVPVYGLVDLKYLKASVGISESQIHMISNGDKAEISLMVSQEIITAGKVTALPSSVDPAAGIFPVTIECRNPGNWFPGMAVKTKITSSMVKHQLMIPAEGVLVSSEGEAYCYKYRSEKGDVIKTDISLGELSDDKIELLSGLSEGDRIVVKGVNKIRDGEKVTPLTELKREGNK